MATGQQLAAELGTFGLVSYVLVYTPLKRRTTLNTLIGAVPGAVPPLIGWAAARGRLDTGGLALFLIVLLWQVPHFLAIAWIYRDEYARAGLRMLPVFDPDGDRTGRQMVRYTLVLVLASLLPFVLGMGGWISGLGTLFLGGVFLYPTVAFARNPTTHRARQVFHASLFYLPAVLSLLVLDTVLFTRPVSHEHLAAAGRRREQNLSTFSPVSPPAELIRTLSILIFAITGFIFVVVEGILIYSLIRFRRRGRAAAEGATEPPQVYGSKPIEIAWTAAPLLIVIIIVLVSARTLWDVTIDPPQPQAGDNSLFVTVVGRQWWWEYRYDQYNGQPLGFVTANELHIPVSEDGNPRPVFLTLKSADVYHSFWVPRLAGKTALIPGRTNSMWFQTSETGLFVGQCAEYCGTQHANMLLRSGRRHAGGISDLARQPKPEGRRRSGSGGPRRESHVSLLVVRQLPPGARHRGGRQLCPRPDPPDEPRHARLGYDLERSGGEESACLDRRSAGHQVRQARLLDAVVRLER